ncbi:MAG TPA: ABC transporter ATP-binding protein [Parachlamydiaceae bacterium]|nr:ABC transporter ATP-binding protein [Parachlamydiaceae bacterium]
MRRLFSIAFQHHKHRFLILLTLIAMCFLTVASQLEIFTLGVITKKGPEFFELFAPIEDGQLIRTQEITQQQLEHRFQQMDTSGTGVVTQEDASQFFSKWRHKDFIESTMNFVDGFVNVTGNVINLAIMVVFVAIFKAITLFIHRFSTRLVAIRLSSDLRQEYFDHIQSLPMSFYQKYNMGSLSSRVVGDAAMIAEAVNACLVNYIQTPFTIVTTLTICFLTSWQLSLIIFFGFPLLVIPIVFLSRRVKRISKQIQKNQEHFTSVILDFLGGIQTVKVFAMEDFSQKKYREKNERMAALEKKSARYDLSSRPIIHTIGMMFLATALLYGLYVLHMSVAEVLFYCGMLYIFYEPIKKFAEENSHIQRGIAAAERMFEVLDLKPDILDGANAEELKDFDGPIEFDNVSFRYGDEWVLKNLSFTVKKGESVALVGPTGAGKSTIAQLLPRLYDVQQGEVRINGKPINTFTQKSIREQIAFIPQKPFLFLDTISANIAYGRGFSDDNIEMAAKKAHADEFIQLLPLKYATELDEGGKNLSGGQQQRLAIARALVKQAPILVMDEATSSLDAVSESYIKSSISKLQGHVTQIIIAHRLSTIDHVDRIIYLEKGEKVAEGSIEELLKTCPNFKKMWDMSLHQ